jgi:hypothetical protein
MKMLTSVTLLVFCAAVIAVGAQGSRSQAPSIAGRWIITTSEDGPHGKTSMPLVVTQDGRKVTAKLTPPHGEELTLAGEFANRELKLATAAEKDTHPAVTLQAKLKDDGSLAGVVSGPMGDVTWTAVRAKDLP